MDQQRRHGWSARLGTASVVLGACLLAGCAREAARPEPVRPPAGLRGFSGLEPSPVPMNVTLGPLGDKRPVAEAYRGGYEFTTDWFTWNIPIWEKALAPYKGRPGLRYLEVGTYEGGSLFWVLENVLTDPGSRATVMDVFEGGDYFSRFQSNLRKSGAEARVTVLKGYSQVALREQPLAAYDIVYIDGSHSADDVLEDAVLAWRLLKPGGLLVFDDYPWRPASPRPADWPGPGITAFHTFYGRHFDVVHVGYQLMYRRKADDAPAGREPAASGS